MVERIMAMSQDIECISACVWEDGIMDIVVEDSEMFSWDESPELISLLEFLNSSCVRHDTSHGYSEYHFSDGSIVFLCSGSYED